MSVYVFRHNFTKKLLIAILFVFSFILTIRSYKETVTGDKKLDSSTPPYREDRIIIAKSLKPFSGKKYVMLCSEAGFLPYYSEWIAIDPAGLYDEYIAHNALTMEYLDIIKPELIMFSAQYSKWAKNMTGNYYGGKWNLMIQTLYQYAKRNNYILVAIVKKIGTTNVHWYYLKNKCPDKDEIIKAITEHNELIYLKKYPVK